MGKKVTSPLSNFSSLRCEGAKKETEHELQTAKNAVTECQDQQSKHVIKQGELEDELADLKSELWM